MLFDPQNDAIICRLTSIFHTGPLDITIADWQAAGLLKPCVARPGRVMTAEKAIFIRHLGSLSAADLEAVRTAWNRHMRL